jgi:hypothetical protein
MGAHVSKIKHLKLDQWEDAQVTLSSIPMYCTIGYSDFHNLMGFTSKKIPNNILKMFVLKVFQLVRPFLANLHSTSSKKYSYVLYSMTPKNIPFLPMNIQNSQGAQVLAISSDQ